MDAALADKPIWEMLVVKGVTGNGCTNLNIRVLSILLFPTVN